MPFTQDAPLHLALGLTSTQRQSRDSLSSNPAGSVSIEAVLAGKDKLNEAASAAIIRL